MLALFVLMQVSRLKSHNCGKYHLLQFCTFIASNISIPYFNGITSYLVHPTLVNAFAITYFYVEIRPSSSNGLILFNGQNNGPDYVALLLRNGHAEFHYNLGGGPAIIVSNTNLTVEQWHSIEARRNGRSGTLIVNNQMPITGESPRGYNSLQLSGDLLIGGLIDTMILPGDLSTAQHFHGCIRDFQLRTSGGQPLPLISAAVRGADISDCPACQCRNGGVCIEGSESSYLCDCPLEYTGLLCENELCTINNPCQNGGRCYPVEGESGAVELMCNCSLPFGGDRCDGRKYITIAGVFHNSYYTPLC